MQRPEAVPSAGIGHQPRRRKGIKLPKPSDYEIRGHVRLYLRCPSCAGAIPIALPDPAYTRLTCTLCGSVVVRRGA